MSRKLTQQQFIERSRLAHGDKYDYSKSVYTTTQAKVTIICPSHGEFQQQAGHHMNGISCKRCGVESAQAKTRTTLDEFITKAREVHGDKYDYSQVDYQGTMVKVDILCPEHGVFKQIPMDHLKGRGCWACTGLKKRTQEEFIAQSKAIWGDKYDYSEVVYKNHESKVILTCDQGHRFEQLVSSHLNGFNCPHCSGLARKTTEGFVAEAKARFGDKFDYSKVEYVNSRTPVTIICPVIGEFEMKPTQHLISNTGYTSNIVNTPTSKEVFIEKAKKVHGDAYDYSKVEYKGKRKKVTIICKEHGEFWQLAQNHYKGQGCPACGCRGGFDSTKPGTLYYLRILHDGELFYKIGITNYSVAKRYLLIDKEKIAVVREWFFNHGQTASDIETEILRIFKNFRIPNGSNVLTSGNTEIFTEDVLCLDILT